MDFDENLGGVRRCPRNNKLHLVAVRIPFPYFVPNFFTPVTAVVYY